MQKRRVKSPICTKKLGIAFLTITIMMIIFWVNILNIYYPAIIETAVNYQMMEDQLYKFTDNLPKSVEVPVASNCSVDKMMTLRKQLPAKHCVDVKSPWLNRCSFSYATRCPRSTWFEKYYLEEVLKGSESSFLGVSVGCNKGFDAIDTARLGTLNPVFDKIAFAKGRGVGNETKEDLRCERYGINDQLDLSNISPVNIRSGEMHCIEGLPRNAKTLRKAVTALGLEDSGFVVSNVAISDVSGKISFPLGEDRAEGVENLGIEACSKNKNKNSKNCVEIDVYTLDSYFSKFVSSSGPVNHLSIDIEGYDAAAIQGATEVLRRTEYLEFEYNWVGIWRQNKLSKIIESLNGKDFSCYFIGNGELWRITGCWQDHYGIHRWSNVGCANRRLAPKLFDVMEGVFNQTLGTEVASLYYVLDRRIGTIRDQIILNEIRTGTYVKFI